MGNCFKDADNQLALIELSNFIRFSKTIYQYLPFSMKIQAVEAISAALSSSLSSSWERSNENDLDGALRKCVHAELSNHFSNS